MNQTGTGEPRDPHEDERLRMRAVVGSDRIERFRPRQRLPLKIDLAMRRLVERSQQLQ